MPARAAPPEPPLTPRSAGVSVSKLYWPDHSAPSLEQGICAVTLLWQVRGCGAARRDGRERHWWHCGRRVNGIGGLFWHSGPRK